MSEPPTPLVSVVMSVFDGEPFVRESVASVLDQTHHDLELVVIDDGSRDGTVDVLEGFDDPRLVIRRQDNAGLTVSLNRAIALARGRFVARQDADDVSHPDRIERQLRFLLDHPDVALVGCQVDLIDEAGRQFGGRTYATDSELLWRLHIEENQFAHGALMFRKNAISEIGGYDEYFRFAQDYDLTLRLQERYRCANLAESHYALRHCRAKVSRRHGDEQVAYGALARQLARARRSGLQMAFDNRRPLSDYVEVVPIERCSYEEEIVFESLRCGFNEVARSQLRMNIRTRPARLSNYLRYAATFLPWRP